MKVTTTITNKEFRYIHEYINFFRNRITPCSHCSPSDRAACCGCGDKEKYDKELEQFKERWCCMDDNIVLNPTVKEYMDALNRADKAAKELDKATLEWNFAKSQVEGAFAKLTIEDAADSQEYLGDNEAADRYYSETPYTEEE